MQPTNIKTPAPAAAPAKAGYVPPHLRKEAAAAPIELNTESLADTALFPTLGGTKKSATPKPKPSTNTFAALDEPDTPTTTGTGAPLNFKEMIEERRRRDEEAALQAEAEPDIYSMSAEKLEALGFVALKIPKLTDKDYCEGFNDRLMDDEAWHAETYGIEWV